MKTAIFLGAGASAAEGAPIQSGLFKAYFGSPDVQKNSAMYADLKQFFGSIFNINLEDPIIKFPTFEEALGILDLAENRKESLRGFSFGEQVPGVQMSSAASRIQLLRLDLILVMAKAIDDGIRAKKQTAQSTKGPHARLIDNLRLAQPPAPPLLANTIFISTNYDLSIDQALGDDRDYDVDFAADSTEPLNPGLQSVKLFKLHGSLNWLYCAVCNNVKQFGSKAALSLAYEGRSVNSCGYCESIMSPVIVPPTFYKDMSRVFLSRIWNKTEDALREVEHVIFCGYSLPDADMHIKYLLKRMQTNRPSNMPVKFTLVNHHYGDPQKGIPPKQPDVSEVERERYERFFGAQVIDSGKSFEDFIESPANFYAGIF
jgi:hypothetical protein